MKVGDVITFEELANASLPPSGTVLIPDNGTQPRVIADNRIINPGDATYIFTDQSGFLGIKEFTVAYVPEAPKKSLAAELFECVYLGATYQYNEGFERAAVYVLENYDRKTESRRELVDGENDRWLQNDGGTWDIYYSATVGGEASDSMYVNWTIEDIESEFGVSLYP